MDIEARLERMQSEIDELQRQLGDERSDRERADDALRSEIQSVEHKVNYGT